MNILMTGGTGFLGRAIADSLAGEGHQMIVLTRYPGRAPDRLRVRHAAWDGTSVEPLLGVVGYADAVINLAGASIGGGRWTARRRKEILESRVRATRAIVDAMRSSPHRPAVLINASAVGVYGGRGEEVLTEASTGGTGFLASVVKLWEAETQAARRLGVRVAQLRMGTVLGPDGGALASIALPFRLFAGAIPGTGDQWFPWVHRTDVVRAVHLVLTLDDLEGPINVVAPEQSTMGDLCHGVAVALHRPCWMRVPASMLRLLLGEFASALLDSQYVIPEILLNREFAFEYPSLSLALAASLHRR